MAVNRRTPGASTEGSSSGDTAATERSPTGAGTSNSETSSNTNTDQGDEGAAREPATDDAAEANSATAARNSGGARTMSGVGATGVVEDVNPKLSEATAPTSDPSVKPNPHESIPTHTIGRADYERTINAGAPLDAGTEIIVATDVDYTKAENVLDLNDPVATQEAHLRGLHLNGVGEGRRVDTRTMSIEAYIPNLATVDQLSKLKEGDKFYALWLFNPGTDSMRWYRDNRNDLVSGRLTRNSLPVEYWAQENLNAPPLAERTAKGYKLLPIESAASDEE